MESASTEMNLLSMV